MNFTTPNPIVLNTTVNLPIDKVWLLWNEPEHITKWVFASSDWHAPSAINDLKPGGRFLTRMEAKDGSFGFDFEGIYHEVIPHELITYTLSDGRFVKIEFQSNGNQTEIIESFDAESENTIEMQQAGWQSILNNFKNYAELQG